MTENENIVTGKKLRHFVDGTWELISFWHKASDCEMENGNNLEDEIQNIKDYRNNLLVYNPDTDYYQGYINGEWKDIIYAGSNLYIIKDGIIKDPHTGGLTSTSDYISVSDFTDFNELCIELINHNFDESIREMSYIQTAEQIDLTNYKYLYLKSHFYSFPRDGSITIQLLKGKKVYTKGEGKEYSLTRYAYELEEVDGYTNILGINKDVMTFDISDIVGKYYIAINFECHGNSAININIGDMWLN